MLSICSLSWAVGAVSGGGPNQNHEQLLPLPKAMVLRPSLRVRLAGFGATRVLVISAAQQNGAAELVDPRPFAVGTIAETFEHYPDIGTLLPAMGYGDEQIDDLEQTINACDCDAVVIGTPIDLGRIVNIEKPHTRVTYELERVSGPALRELLEDAVG